MSKQLQEDRALARRVVAGDHQAFEVFFHEHFPRLYRFALVRVGHDQDHAREVVQATLCKAVDKLHTYRGRAPLFTWLCSCCRNEIIELQRKARRTTTVDWMEDSPDVRAALQALAATAADDPDAALLRKEVARLVHATLDHLPPHYGKALELRYLEGLGVSEIAARLELGYKAAESVLSRARAAFRHGFEEVVAAVPGGLAAEGFGP